MRWGIKQDGTGLGSRYGTSHGGRRAQTGHGWILASLPHDGMGFSGCPWSPGGGESTSLDQAQLALGAALPTRKCTAGEEAVAGELQGTSATPRPLSSNTTGQTHRGWDTQRDLPASPYIRGLLLCPLLHELPSLHRTLPPAKRG